MASDNRDLFEGPELTEDHVVDELRWCWKEAGYAKTETRGTPNSRLNEIHDRLYDALQVLKQDETYSPGSGGK